MRQQGDATIQNKAGVLGLYLQLALENYDRRTKQEHNPKELISNDHINYGRLMHPEGIILQEAPLQVACYSIIQWD